MKSLFGLSILLASVSAHAVTIYSYTGNTGLTDAGGPPVPAAVWLFGSGLGLLGWLRRKQNA